MAPPIPKPPPGAAMTVLKLAIANAHVIPAFAKLGIFDRLAERPRGISELAEATGTDASALARVLPLFRFTNLIGESAGVFRLTDAGMMLVGSDDAALRGTTAYLERWSSLETMLRGGARTASPVDVEALERGRVAEAHRAVLEHSAAGFARSETYADVESGDPALLAAILQKSARAEGIFIGNAPDLERAKAVLSAAGVARRCELALPQPELPPADAFVVSHRLELLDDDEAIALLARARRAMKANGRVVVIGHVFGTVFDLELLLLTPHGRVRTDAEVRTLCERASLAPRRTVIAAESTSIVEAGAA